MEHILTTYIRTKLVFKNRLHDLSNYNTVKITKFELSRLGVPDYMVNTLINTEIIVNEMGEFATLNDGPIDPKLLDITRKGKPVIPLTNVHLFMRDQLMFITLKEGVEKIPVYFSAFLLHRKENLSSFFTVDAFSNRVHTPVVNLKSHLRKKILFDGQPMISLDVKQMQPLILSKVLLNVVGDNPFSTLINNGKDVYISLYENNVNIKSRDEAKKTLYQLIFGRPQETIKGYFQGNVTWIDWINEYKTRTEEKNPHKHSPHTNLAWLLQYSEVQIMYNIWEKLSKKKIPFLTIHDDILCLKKDKSTVYDYMKIELKKHFPVFDITITENDS